MDYRTYSKLLTTYAEALPKYIVDGRIHTNFNQTETATRTITVTDSSSESQDQGNN